MKKVGKIFKWLLKSIGLLLALIIVAGLVVRLFGPEPHEPLGELVDIGGFQLHINATGEKSDRPTLVIEGGSGTATEFYHWLSEGLKDSMRVVRYDRAGIGYSEANGTARDPETIARELHTLLEKAGESPPYIMAGHSLGGPYIRVFTELYPDEVIAMCLLDTTHPERVKRISSIPKADSWKFKTMIGLQRAQAVLADLGVLMLYDKLAGPILGREMEGLPDEINSRTVDFLINGRYLHAMTDEMAYYHNTLERAGAVTDFGDLPVRIFPSAEREVSEEAYQRYLKRGLDLRENQRISGELQKDYLNLSTDSKLIEVNGDHNTIYTKKENAAVICGEILQLLKNYETSQTAAQEAAEGQATENE